MQRLTLPINEIKVENRQRLDLGDLTELIESIRIYGLIQPIVVSQEKRLIAGGRRLASCIALGRTDVDVVFRETLSEDELYILELEENIRRKDETWQERTLHILTIHLLKQKVSALDSTSWGQRETGELLGIKSKGQIAWAICIAQKLREELNPDKSVKPDARFWHCDSLSDAWRLWCRDQEDIFRAELALRSAKDAVPAEFFAEEMVNLAEFETVESSVDLLSAERERYYSNHLNPPGSFDSYWEEKQKWAEQLRNTIHLSNKFHNVDSIAFMNHPDNASRFDHVITDIPYGIDMDMLNQQNQHGGMQNIDTVEELHDVQYNKQLIADFFPAAFKCTKENAFVITWADQMLWQFMYDCAIKAGFAVQRWPITWCKTSNCMNQCAGFNTTKDTEIAIVCRKKGATLVWQPATSYIEASRDELSEAIRHPFAKPFAVWERLLQMTSLEGQLILEPFMGGGSGVISMLRMNRNVIGCELDVNHFNEGVENVKTLHYRKINPNYQFK
jgi:DNA modification methylase